ncbi:MAG: aldehyde dehydrogenase family protein, partial [Chromatocurvus sp.]
MRSAREANSIADEFGFSLPECVPGFVGGQACQHAESSHRFEHICPATEETLYSVIECDAGVVDDAVAAARTAFDSGGWSRMSCAARKPVLRRMIDVIDRHRDELAAIQSLEVGLPLSGVQGMHMQRTIDNFDFFIEVADTLGGHSYTQTGRYTSLVTREPAGVVALLSPWNAPLVLSSMKLAAALALGNSCVIKASEYSPWSLYRFVEILHEADIPPGLINLVNGRGAVTGKALVEHSGVDVIGFVGGTATGREIIRSSAAGIRKVGLELGGKSANIVLDSANLESAVDGSLIAILAGNGEQCLAGSRILVQDAVADEFLETFLSRMR